MSAPQEGYTSSIKENNPNATPNKEINLLTRVRNLLQKREPQNETRKPSPTPEKNAGTSVENPIMNRSNEAVMLMAYNQNLATLQPAYGLFKFNNLDDYRTAVFAVVGNPPRITISPEHEAHYREQGWLTDQILKDQLLDLHQLLSTVILESR